MKCPRCKSHNLELDTVKGFSNDPIKECKQCGYKWIKKDGKEIKDLQ